MKSLIWATRTPGAALAFLVVAGCASSGRDPIAEPVVAEARDLPDHFMVAASGVAKKTEPKPGEGCRNPMVDPRDGTSLNLLRSKGDTGDYQVMSREFELTSRYGVDSQHLLRVDCGTGKALGIVSQ
jgi:hypothetical protein